MRTERVFFFFVISIERLVFLHYHTRTQLFSAQIQEAAINSLENNSINSLAMAWENGVVQKPSLEFQVLQKAN